MLLPSFTFTGLEDGLFGRFIVRGMLSSRIWNVVLQRKLSDVAFLLPDSLFASSTTAWSTACWCLNSANIVDRFIRFQEMVVLIRSFDHPYPQKQFCFHFVNFWLVLFIPRRELINLSTTSKEVYLVFIFDQQSVKNGRRVYKELYS